MRKYFTLVWIFYLLGCSVAPFQPLKFNGVSFVASHSVIDSTHIQPVINIHANSAAIMPFGFIKDKSHPEILYDTNKQWFGETIRGSKQYIEELQKKDFKIMVKPQIWIWNGEFTGFLKMNTEEDWEVLENSYSKMILEFAKMAEDVNAEVFCIGTELENFITHRPKFWELLIDDVKNVYHGKLTYAANWDEYKRVPFWEKLDYIGIDAYFPVSDKKTPTFEDALRGWKAHKSDIQKFSETKNKPILFTEYGYRSVDYSGKEPWKSDRNMTCLNIEVQMNTTKALFETFWKEDWFAGGFVWKWFVDHDRVGGAKNNQFTPQNKPVEKIIKSYYKKHQ